MGVSVSLLTKLRVSNVTHQDALAPTEAIVSGNPAVLAGRYADALYALADEQKEIDAVAADMRTLTVLQRESAEFRHLAHNPRLTRNELTKIAKQVASAAKLAAITSNFLALLAHNRRLALLPTIANRYLAELARRRGEFTAEVRTARPLSHAQEEQLASSLRSLAGGKVHLTVREDRTLLGGLTVKLGSRLIDASVRGKLERLARTLQSQSAAYQKGAA
jgi:F-type H+-transporting ATPase subunit delta